MDELRKVEPLLIEAPARGPLLGFNELPYGEVKREIRKKIEQND
jgi:hypothetical protein